MKCRIAGRLETEHSQMQITRYFNVRPRVVYNLWKQFKVTGSIERKPSQDGPRATTANEERYLSITGSVNKTATASQLSWTFMRPQGVEFQGLLFVKDYMTKGCLQQDLLFASRSLLQTGEHVSHGATIN